MFSIHDYSGSTFWIHCGLFVAAANAMLTCPRHDATIVLTKTKLKQSHITENSQRPSAALYPQITHYYSILPADIRHTRTGGRNTPSTLSDGQVADHVCGPNIRRVTLQVVRRLQATWENQSFFLLREHAAPQSRYLRTVIQQVVPGILFPAGSST